MDTLVWILPVGLNLTDKCFKQDWEFDIELGQGLNIPRHLAIYSEKVWWQLQYDIAAISSYVANFWHSKITTIIIYVISTNNGRAVP